MMRQYLPGVDLLLAQTRMGIVGGWLHREAEIDAPLPIQVADNVHAIDFRRQFVPLRAVDGHRSQVADQRVTVVRLDPQYQVEAALLPPQSEQVVAASSLRAQHEAHFLRRSLRSLEAETSPDPVPIP